MQFVGLDTPQHVLVNCSSLVLLVGNFFVLFIIVLVSSIVFGSVWPISFVFAVAIATTWSRIRPPNPFSGGFFGGPRKPLEQHEESALRVLTFFCSPQAKRLIWKGSALMLLLGAGLWFPTTMFKPKVEPADLLSTSIVMFMCWFMFFSLTTLLHFSLMARYALKHWEELQRQYQPWPIEQVYEIRVRDRFKLLLEVWHSKHS